MRFFAALLLLNPTDALSLSKVPARPPLMAIVAKHPTTASVQMMARSNWAALDDGAPLGLLEKDAGEVFTMLDDNGDGAITMAEMSEKLLACDYTKERIELVFGKIDTDGNGVLSPEEFKAAYVKYPTLRTAPGIGGALKKKLEAAADALFATLDTDGDGTISLTELQDHLKSVIPAYSDDLIQTIMKGIDLDNSGEIDKGELRKAFLLHPTIRTAKGLGGSI